MDKVTRLIRKTTESATTHNVLGCLFLFYWFLWPTRKKFCVQITLIRSTKYSKQQMTIKFRRQKCESFSLYIYFTWQLHRMCCVYVREESLPFRSYAKLNKHRAGTFDVGVVNFSPVLTFRLNVLVHA